ncbi:MAG: hypothetical protein JNL49_01565 [Bacteroidia bacterium]|nr:hypothetical protein [Bacteroidia bacterium]
MKYKYIDIPSEISLNSYETAIERMVATLLQSESVKCIYQIGGVSSPGISDIDLYVVFHDNQSFLSNPVEKLSFPDNQLFTHKLFGCCESFATQLEQFTYFGNYKLLGGTPVIMNNYFANIEEDELLKKQIAIEYLIKAWFSIYINITYGLIKLRSLLLHSKAILYDLDFLDIKTGKLHECIHELLEIRKNYFQTKPDFKKLDLLCETYSQELENEIIKAISNYKFYISKTGNRQISKRANIVYKAKPGITNSGVTFPIQITKNVKSIQRLQNKLNSYKVGVPFEETNLPAIISKRSEIIGSAINYNRTNLPNFISTAYGINIF